MRMSVGRMVKSVVGRKQRRDVVGVLRSTYEKVKMLRKLGAVR
jgi:hypothetical protein